MRYYVNQRNDGERAEKRSLTRESKEFCSFGAARGNLSSPTQSQLRESPAVTHHCRSSQSVGCQGEVEQSDSCRGGLGNGLLGRELITNRNRIGRRDTMWSLARLAFVIE